MKRRTLIAAVCSALCVLSGCSREGGDPVPAGYGSLTLRLVPSAPASKADPSLEGDAFRNALVVITDSHGQVVDKEYREYGTSVALTRDDVSFHDLKVGVYHVYAYANIGHDAWQQDGATVTDVEAALSAGESLDVTRELKLLTGTDTPAVPSGTEGMLLTGHRQLSVGVNENIGEVPLLRPVTRLNLYVHNFSPYPVTLEKLSFSPFNPSSTYLLDARTESGEPTLPAGNTYRSLSPYDESAPAVIPRADGENSGNALVYSTLLYENQYTDDYRVFATVSVTDANALEHTRDLVTDGVRALPYTEVAAMAPGESRQVLLVTPNTSNGVFVGTKGGTRQFSQARYVGLDSYTARAAEIVKDPSISSYYILTLKRTEDGRFELWNGTQNLFNNLSGNKETSLTLVEGRIPTFTDFPIGSEMSAYLCRFRDSGNRWLYTLNNQLLVHTWGGNDSEARGNRMWMFYEVHPKGSVIKTIDNETAQVQPLRCMLRNQEINIVLNVYWKEVSSTLDFAVDNAYWTDEGGHSSSHIFQ